VKLKKSYYFIVIVSLLILLIGFRLHGLLSDRAVERVGSYGTKLMLGSKVLMVEVAETPKEREQGLSDRKNLCLDCGMLFIFDQPGIYPFWMRRMYFDIDILWIADDRVVDVTLGAKVSSKEEFAAPKTFYRSRVPIDKVLEVDAGWVEKNGIKAGDVVKY